MKKIFLLTFILLIFNSSLFSQCYLSSKGKEFWVGFLQNDTTSQTDPVNRELCGYDSLRIFISSKVNTSGNVSIPLQGFSKNFTVASNSTTTVIIPILLGQDTSSEIIAKKGILIQALDTVNVFAQHALWDSDDATLVLPIASLGTDYCVVSYKGYSGSLSTSQPMPSEFTIIATQDGSQIKITPTAKTLAGRPAGIPFTIILNRGESYQVKAAQNISDLTGTTIVETSGNKPIAVFSGAQCSRVSTDCFAACDHLYEQDLPSAFWGTQFHIMPFKNIPDHDLERYTYRILALKNGTAVTINGGSPISISVGVIYEKNYINDPLCINSNLPISVIQYMESKDCDFNASLGKYGDPAMLILQSDEKKIFHAEFKTFPTNVSYVRDPGHSFHNSDTAHVNVLIESTNINLLKLDGSPVNIALFNTFPSCPEYSYLQLPITLGDHVLESRTGLIAYLYSVEQHDSPESYALSLGFDIMIPAIVSLSNTTICKGAGTTLTVNNGWEYSWLPSRGLTLSNNISFIANPESTTTYTITGKNACGNSTDTLRVRVISLDAGPNITIEQGAYTVFHPSQAKNYLWFPAKDLNGDTIKNPIASPPNTTYYYLMAIDSFGCSSKDSLLVTVLIPEMLYMPNSFTPNEDGKNDLFYFYNAIDETGLQSIDIKIFDRWGILLFSTSNIQQGWDGKYNGNKAPEDVYLCQVHCIWKSSKEETFAKKFNLIR